MSPKNGVNRLQRIIIDALKSGTYEPNRLLEQIRDAHSTPSPTRIDMRGKPLTPEVFEALGELRDNEKTHMSWDMANGPDHTSSIQLPKEAYESIVGTLLSPPANEYLRDTMANYRRPENPVINVTIQLNGSLPDAMVTEAHQPLYPIEKIKLPSQAQVAVWERPLFACAAYRPQSGVMVEPPRLNRKETRRIKRIGYMWRKGKYTKASGKSSTIRLKHYSKLVRKR